MFEIKKNVPLPEFRRRGAASLYPFSQMEIGDSFFVDIPHGEDSTKTIANVKVSSFRWRKRHGKNRKFNVIEHPHPDTGVPAVGIWRTE